MTMQLFFTALHNIGDNIVEAVFPVSLAAAGIGMGLFLFQAYREKSRMKFKISLAISAYFLFFVAVGFYRASNRYFLLLLFPVIFFCGYLFTELYRKKPFFAYALVLLFIVSFTLKHLRIDRGVAITRAYLVSLSSSRPGQTAALFALDHKEASRNAFYSGLPLKKLTQYDFTDPRETTMLQQIWQRYLYEYDSVYLQILRPTKAKWHPSADFFQDRCDFKLDFEIPRGLKKRKTLQIFRLANANSHVPIPATTTSSIPRQVGPKENFCRWSDYPITPLWHVTDHAVVYVKSPGTCYQVYDHKTHWELLMAGDHYSSLRTNAIDLSKPFHCYIEYYGDAEVPLDVNLQMQNEKVYRDNTIAYLPLKGDRVKKSIKLSFYPSMNPENLRAFLVFRLPGKGHIHITRLAFEKVL